MKRVEYILLGLAVFTIVVLLVLGSLKIGPLSDLVGLRLATINTGEDPGDRSFSVNQGSSVRPTISPIDTTRPTGDPPVVLGEKPRLNIGVQPEGTTSALINAAFAEDVWRIDIWTAKTDGAEPVLLGRSAEHAGEVLEFMIPISQPTKRGVAYRAILNTKTLDTPQGKVFTPILSVTLPQDYRTNPLSPTPTPDPTLE